MPNSKQIVYLSQAQYQELITNGTITVDGVTVTYDENDIYVTPQAEPVTDVRINGTSIAANGVANIPTGSAIQFGVMRAGGPTFGVTANDGIIAISGAGSSQIKTGSGAYLPIVVSHQHEATFYGLAKVAGHDEASSTEPLGTYTPEAKGAIQQMLGVSDLITTAENDLVASKAYAVGDIFTANGKLYKVTTAIAADGAIILQNEGETVSGANAVETSVSDRLDNSWTKDDFRFNALNGITVNNDGYLTVQGANEAYIKGGRSYGEPILPTTQHISTFYGLAKAAGSDEKDSTLPVGQYTDTAKVAIRSMLGATSSNVIAVQDTQPTDTDTKIWLPETAETPVTVPTVAEMESALSGKVGDVQIDGTSIVTNGVAEIPIANNTTLGLVAKGGGNMGIAYNQNMQPYITGAASADIKPAANTYRPIVPSHQHEAVFYGLAKSAGDTTQSASSNTVGTYTDNAKASIKAMLGIQDGSTGTVDVSGTTPTITAVENTRYVCGEVTSLNFTPAASGICIVRFTSGSTVTVLTLPSTVKFPEWFDSTSLETNTIYEICVTDGIYGAVMLWAL